MRTYECPSCGAPVPFASGAGIFSVCPHCRSMVVRSDVKLEAIGTMAELPPDLSPLQLGTRGRWAGRAFTLWGRVRLAWEDGSWTEWHAVFDDGSRGWLAETQGFFALSFINRAEAAPRQPARLKAGETVDFARRRWKVMDVKRAQCLAAEGELPFVTRPGAERLSVDLAGPAGEFGTLEEEEGEVAFFEGVYARFDELGLENLRPIPGWSDGPAEPVRRRSRTLSCVHCGAPVSLRADGLTMAVVCGSCGTLLDTSHPDVKVIQRAQATLDDLKPALPLGRRGNFGGLPFEVIGYLVRADAYSRWSEYLLFNPWHGFLWLVTYQGHWSLVYRLLAPPRRDGPSTVWHNDTPHLLYAESETRVHAVLGEFYWRVSRGEVSQVYDYVAPPWIVSRETYPGLQEETWSAGEYRTPAEIAEAFSLPEPLPPPTGPYLNQPNPFVEKWARVRNVALVALVLLVGIQAWAFLSRPDRSLFTGQFTAPAAADADVVSSPVFHLEGPNQPVQVRAEAPLQNSWLDLSLELVNTSTGETRTAQLPLSYYSGADSDGPWSEGSRSRTADFPAVPAGDYLLRMDPAIEAGVRPLPFSVRVTAGGVFWSNFFLCLGGLALYPAWVRWRLHAFERERWADSSYSPYVSLESDDD